MKVRWQPLFMSRPKRFYFFSRRFGILHIGPIEIFWRSRS